MKSDQKGKKTSGTTTTPSQISILAKGLSMQVKDNKHLHQQACVLISKHKPRITTAL
jgi:hypothetical protein